MSDQANPTKLLMCVLLGGLYGRFGKEGKSPYWKCGSENIGGMTVNGADEKKASKMSEAEIRKRGGYDLGLTKYTCEGCCGEYKGGRTKVNSLTNPNRKEEETIIWWQAWKKKCRDRRLVVSWPNR